MIADSRGVVQNHLLRNCYMSEEPQCRKSLNLRAFDTREWDRRLLARHAGSHPQCSRNNLPGRF